LQARIFNLPTHINCYLRKPPLKFSHVIIHIRLTSLVRPI